MLSVTQRIKQVKQPRGGYIRPKEFSEIQLEDGITLNESENIHAILMGLTVDYLTRFMLGTPAKEAFRISLMGAEGIQKENVANELVSNVLGLDSESITNACKLSGFDVVFRAGPMGYKPIETINPDVDTINNIKTLVKRSLKFFEEYGPITKDGFTFEGGYSNIVSSGDGDFLTKDTLWDFKVSKNGPTNKHTLQLLMYYLMGLQSIHKEFNTIKYLGLYNPRLNKVYKLKISNIDDGILKTVKDEVIGY